MQDISACSFTGHRTISAPHRAALSALLSRAVAYAYGEGCRTFYTGGALGFDTYAARAVISFRMTHRDVRLVLLLPCPDQADAWNAHQRTEYEWILGAADEVQYFADSYTKDCMRLRNLALAGRGDLLIAYVGHDRSGAAQTLRAAVRQGKRVYNLYPHCGEKTEETKEEEKIF